MDMASIQDIIDAGGSQTLLLVSAADLREFALAVAQEATERMKQQEPDKDELLTTKQACDAFKIGATTLWRWVKAGLLHPRKAGVKNLFSKDEIEKVIRL